MIRFFRLLRRLAVTVTMLFVLMGTALWSATHSARILPAFVARMGFAVEDFWLLHWERFFTSALITHGERILGCVLHGCPGRGVGRVAHGHTACVLHLLGRTSVYASTVGIDDWSLAAFERSGHCLRYHCVMLVRRRAMWPVWDWLSQPCPTRGEELDFGCCWLR
ncbi:MAG: hypothetical protein R2867_13745 [Caldilineaceae bacterium]